MTDVLLGRRDFLATAAAAATAAVMASPGAAAQDRKGGRVMTIGCHTRPFSRFRLGDDELLDAIKAAGYKSADMIRAPPVSKAPRWGQR